MVCDVGQGTAVAVRVGARSAVVVDAGPDPARIDRCLRRIGVRDVPILILSHFHADHVLGVPGVLRGRSVGEVVVSPLPEPDAQAAAVERWSAAAGVGVHIARVGEVRSVGDVTLRLLGPTRLVAGDSPPNNASVVVLAELPGPTGDVRLLLPGDVEPPAQAVLEQALPGLRADVLVVPHHGSANQDPDWIASLGARLAVVPVGAGNDYGHPAPSLLALLRRLGTTVLRTDTDGAVALVVRSGQVRAVTGW